MSLREILQDAQCQECHPRQYEQDPSRVKRSRGGITALNPLGILREGTRFATPDLLIGFLDPTRPRNKPDRVSKHDDDKQGIQRQRADHKCNHNGRDQQERSETYEPRQPRHNAHPTPDRTEGQEVER